MEETLCRVGFSSSACFVRAHTERNPVQNSDAETELSIRELARTLGIS